MEKNSMENSHNETWNRTAIHIQKRPFGGLSYYSQKRKHIWNHIMISRPVMLEVGKMNREKQD